MLILTFPNIFNSIINLIDLVILAGSSDSVIPESEKLYMEGKIVQKLECRPYADNCYMKLKLQSIKKAAMPARQVQQLDKIVNTYKPVSDHKHNVSYLLHIQHSGLIY